MFRNASSLALLALGVFLFALPAQGEKKSFKAPPGKGVPGRYVVVIRDDMIALAGRDNIFVIQAAGNQSWKNGLTSLYQACDRTFGDEDRYQGTDAEAISHVFIAGGSDELDGRWTTEFGELDHHGGSNIGKCIDLFAPAPHIVSAWIDHPTNADAAICWQGGTSLSAPHVAGVAALVLQHQPKMKPVALKAALLRWAEEGALDANPGSYNYIGNQSPNLLLHWDAAIIFADDFELGSTVSWSTTAP